MHARRPKAYPTDLTDTEWELVQPLLPRRRAGDGRGAPVVRDRREILNAIFYQSRTGCGWDYLPRDFPPKGTVYDYWRMWIADGTWERVHAALREQVRQQANKDPQPSVGILDTQSVKSSPSKQSVSDAGDQVSQATSTLVKDLRGLGKPDTQSGAQAQKTVQQLAAALKAFKCHGNVGDLSEKIRSQFLKKLSG